MRTFEVFRTAAFRLAMLYAALFAAAALVLVGFFDFSVWRYADATLRDDVQAELELLLKTAPSGQSAGVARLIGERERALGADDFLYLVRDRADRRLAGDLPDVAARPGWGMVQIPAPRDSREYDEEKAEVRTLGARLPDGGFLVVGRSTYDFHELGESLVAATVVAGLLITLMSMGVAILIGRQFVSRIDRVNAAAQSIMDGRLEARLPAIGMGEEFDRLAGNLNAMLDRIEALMEGLRQVSSDIAHDLRTPLTRLRGRLETALEAEDGSPDRRALAAEALEQLDEILATFSALLRIAQVEGGTGREAFRPVDVSELMERVRQVYEAAAEDAGKALAARIDPGVSVLGDEELLAQLISNLVENAFAHAGGEGAIDLLVREEGGRALLQVADDGPGVPEAERRKVLRRFYRLDRSRTTPGAGLGLALVQAVAQLHGGQVELADNGPGLIVRIRLPILAVLPTGRQFAPT